MLARLLLQLPRRWPVAPAARRSAPPPPSTLVGHAFGLRAERFQALGQLLAARREPLVQRARLGKLAFGALAAALHLGAQLLGAARLALRRRRRLGGGGGLLIGRLHGRARGVGLLGREIARRGRGDHRVAQLGEFGAAAQRSGAADGARQPDRAAGIHERGAGVGAAHVRQQVAHPAARRRRGAHALHQRVAVAGFGRRFGRVRRRRLGRRRVERQQQQRARIRARMPHAHRLGCGAIAHEHRVQVRAEVALHEQRRVGRRFDEVGERAEDGAFAELLPFAQQLRGGGRETHALALQRLQRVRLSLQLMQGVVRAGELGARRALRIARRTRGGARRLQLLRCLRHLHARQLQCRLGLLALALHRRGVLAHLRQLLLQRRVALLRHRRSRAAPPRDPAPGVAADRAARAAAARPAPAPDALPSPRPAFPPRRPGAPRAAR